MLTEQLKDQISNEGESITANFKDNNDFQAGKIQGFKDGYEAGGYKYAERWQEADQRAERYEKALKNIANWKLPETGKHWNDQDLTPMSYEACYGSNGVRDYFKALAQEALTPKTTTDDTVNG